MRVHFGSATSEPKSGPTMGTAISPNSAPPIPSASTKTNATCRRENEHTEDMKVKLLICVHSTYPTGNER